MAKPRLQLDPQDAKDIQSMIAQGATVASVISKFSSKYAQSTLYKKVNAAARHKSFDRADSETEDENLPAYISRAEARALNSASGAPIPDDLQGVEKFIARIEELAEVSANDDNPQQFAQLARAYNALLQQKLKIMPLHVDRKQEEKPDMLAARDEFRMKLRDMVQRVLDET